MHIKETNPDLFDDLTKRMKRIEGQARGIQRLLEEGADCSDVVTQLSAMRAALSRVAIKAVACHLGKSMTQELQQGGTGEASVDEIMETFLRLG